MNSIDQMVQVLSMTSETIKISKAQYEEWKKQWLFDAISGDRYGQSFCKYFGMDNSRVLYWLKDNKICERWIEENHVIK